ncbi:outer membrane protein assembly factor BamB [Aliikangiella coralliicola]|uniref:Outer membrane protein assembly factor BamB n=1 Tax=Aliikangiella coralliicola TaxID=2592383 RepID=A0A545UBU2_9GAMM|nr:outer membrane protein assembly factor BamB [Aliikangiella coralliicola]TQV86893.1 outer membrane protein assembly factor BamB [Aliikangiella coralliicola]
MRLIFWGIIVAVILVSGCSDEVDIYEPDPLVELDNQFETEELWSVSIGDGTTDTTVKVSPVFAYGKIFVAENSGQIAAVNHENGDIVWRTELETEIGGGPAVANDLVAVGTQHGELVVLSAEDGSIKWRKSVSSEVISSPAIGDGYVVVNSVDGKITAFDAETGEQKWFYDQLIPSLTLRGNSSPVIAGGGAISGFSNGKLAVFLLQNGRMAWEKTITAPIGRSEIQKLVDVDIRPQVAGANIYVASYNGNLASLDARNGEVNWQRELSTFQEITVSELILLVTHENSFVSAVNRDNGIILWTQKSLHRRQLTPPVAVGDKVAAADFEGYLHWFSRQNGEMLSREQIDSDGISAAPLVIEDKIILLGNSGTLYAVKQE